MTKVKKVCDRCDGRGYIPQWKDAMHQDGICFKCKGSDKR